MHTKNLLEALSLETVKNMVRNELQTYDADKTGRTDYALESSGSALSRAIYFYLVHFFSAWHILTKERTLWPVNNLMRKKDKKVAYKLSFLMLGKAWVRFFSKFFKRQCYKRNYKNLL